MINYNEAFNSARLVPGAHKYISDWRKNAENFRNSMLEQSKAEIDFEYSDTGDTILVPADKHASVKMQMAMKGLPKTGNVGANV